MEQEYKAMIEKAWDHKEHRNEEVKNGIEKILEALDRGELRVVSLSEKGDVWHTHEWVKKAILLSFGLNSSFLMESGVVYNEQKNRYYDKVPLKFANWSEQNFQQAKIRAVPGAIVRHSAYIGSHVVLMPCFVNVGAYVDEHTLIDTWSTVGSCAYIGKNCHISGGVGIGGVLEPIRAAPVIIEDGCFIGARSEIAEGVRIGKGSVISMGVYLGASTKIVNRETGEVTYGHVPPYSVVVPGTTPGKTSDAPALYAAIIVKRVDEKTRSKTSINALLREMND